MKLYDGFSDNGYIPWLLTQASPKKPVVVFIRDTTTGSIGNQQEVTSSGEVVDRRHGILRLPVALATTRSPSDSDTNSGDSGRGPSCDEATTDPTTTNNTLRVTTTVTRGVDLPSPRSPASGKQRQN